MQSRELISYQELPAYGVTLSQSQLRRLEIAGEFPKRIYVSPARYRYDKAEIIKHVNNACAKRAKRKRSGRK
jgi:predicted DNA-binding transcriptional regulator AlpA